MPESSRTGEPAWGPAPTALALVAIAVILRLPALLYSVTNFDESLYLLIGSELAQGILPYTSICDRKPFGLFAIFALFAAAPFDAIVASRIGASVAVGLTAWLLGRVAALLFADPARGIGWAAALTYILFSLANGGIASNAEVFHNLFAVLGLWLALLAVRVPGPPRRGLLVAAGLVLGTGLQVKPTVLFDMLAFLAGFFLLTTPTARDLGRHARASLPALAALGLAAVLPTLAVILLYVATGHWQGWATANLAAQRGFVDDPGQKLELDAAFRAMMEQAPLWAMALAAAALGPRLVRGRAGEGRSLAFLFAWVGAIVVAQLFLRIASDHYFLQFLPAFSLLAGLLVGRGLLELLPGRPARAGLLAALAGLALFGVAKNQLVNTAYVLRDRFWYGDRWAADTPRRIAADLAPALRPGDGLYQVGFLPIVYHLTGTKPPTRFAFTGLPHARYAGRDGCPWVPQAVELRRVLDTRPRFVVIEDGVFYKELDKGVRAILDERLARDYRLTHRYEMHWIHALYPFERFVLNAAAPARVYERAGGPEAPAAPMSALPDEKRGDDVVPDHADRDPG